MQTVEHLERKTSYWINLVPSRWGRGCHWIRLKTFPYVEATFITPDTAVWLSLMQFSIVSSRYSILHWQSAQTDYKSWANMNAISNFRHEDIVRSFRARIAGLGFIISNFNVGKWPVCFFLYKLKGYKHTEADNRLKNKHISSICPDWQNSLSTS